MHELNFESIIKEEKAKVKKSKQYLTYYRIGLAITFIIGMILCLFPEINLGYSLMLSGGSSFLLFSSFSDNPVFKEFDFSPKFKVGDEVVVFIDGKVKFTRFDEILLGIPKYIVSKISVDSYLLYLKDNPNEFIEVKFKDHSKIFSIQEIKTSNKPSQSC